MQNGSHPPGKALSYPDALQAALRVTRKIAGAPALVVFDQAARQYAGVRNGKIHAFCAGRGHDMSRIAQQKQLAELHRLGHKTSHGSNALLKDRPVLQHKSLMSGHPDTQFLPNSLVGPILYLFVWFALQIKTRDFRSAHAEQCKTTFVIVIDQLMRRGRNVGEDAQPSEGILPLVEADALRGNRRPANAVKSVAAGDEVARDFVFGVLTGVADPRLRVKFGDVQGLGLKENGLAIANAGANQVLHHLLLAVDGDRFTDEMLKIDAVPLAAETQLHPFVLQAFAFHPGANTGFAQHVHSALFQDTGAHAAFDVLPGMTLQHHAFDSLQVEQMREHQARRAGTHNAHLCSDVCHVRDLRSVQVNFSIISLGIGWLFTLEGSPGSRIVHTRFSMPSTASTSPR